MSFLVARGLFPRQPEPMRVFEGKPSKGWWMLKRKKNQRPKELNSFYCGNSAVSTAYAWTGVELDTWGITSWSEFNSWMCFGDQCLVAVAGLHSSSHSYDILGANTYLLRQESVKTSCEQDGWRLSTSDIAVHWDDWGGWPAIHFLTLVRQNSLLNKQIMLSYMTI